MAIHLRVAGSVERQGGMMEATGTLRRLWLRGMAELGLQAHLASTVVVVDLERLDAPALRRRDMVLAAVAAVVHMVPVVVLVRLEGMVLLVY
ncbi:hypothetical protein V5074_24125 [Atlantibacter hermannii]|uniref:hypothetical protein n=1 Tax=Atlantibacter hermannii TaxID=565 RepID=UPI0028AB8057|nr:hypothetical protein [Atlantibacter hermannii]